MTEELRTKEDLVSELRKFSKPNVGAGFPRGFKLLADAADCIEQLQMPPAKVRELAQTEDGADSLALIRALSMQVEGQRKHIATLESQRDSLQDELTHVLNEHRIIR